MKNLFKFLKNATVLRSILISLLVISTLLQSACHHVEGKRDNTIFVYNWGAYIDMNLLSKFEAETGIKVVYETFNTNEDLYVKLKNSSNRYDIVIPSDYMIEKMYKEGLLQKLDYSQIPNNKYIDEDFLNPDFDPDSAYSIPYFWGTVGILYNPDLVSDPVDSWDILWNPKYAKNIIMLDSSRDNMMIALRRNNFSSNTTVMSELEIAKNDLFEQFPLVYAYLVDQAKDIMINEECAMAVIYSGDALDALYENPKLEFFIPDNSNFWVDAMAIPANAMNVKGAHQFINFMLDPENMAANAEEVGYAIPAQAAKELLDEEVQNDEHAYPPHEKLLNLENFRDIGEFQRIYDEFMQEVKNQ